MFVCRMLCSPVHFQGILGFSEGPKVASMHSKQACVPKMAQRNFSFCKIQCFPLHNVGLGGGPGGGTPPPAMVVSRAGTSLGRCEGAMEDVHNVFAIQIKHAVTTTTGQQRPTPLRQTPFQAFASEGDGDVVQTASTSGAPRNQLCHMWHYCWCPAPSVSRATGAPPWFLKGKEGAEDEGHESSLPLWHGADTLQSGGWATWGLRPNGLSTKNGLYLGYVAQNVIPRAPHFLWFPPLEVTQTDV